MTKEEKMQLLKIWEKRTENLNTQWEEFAAFTGARSDWPFGDAIWRMWEDHTKIVSDLLECDPDELFWYCFDNQLGEQGLECEFNNETREIRTLADLAWMIGLDG
jgi:hypothetical protein